ncbi:MAG: hypothetical protein HOQ28_14410 [Thermoleophilia bacterium]|nr:hypothetical protein [Thermoleophilia bacterium]
MLAPSATSLCLACVAVAAAASSAGATNGPGWRALHRPLHLPQVASNAHCPVSRVDRRVDWPRTHIFGGSGIGTGPVYPALGTRSALIYATRDTQFGSAWYGEKVFWYVLPSYRGPVLIRGRRLDGPERMGFNGTRTPLGELRIDTYDTVHWSGQRRGSRGIASGVRVLAAGCYGIQIDGTSFSRVVVATVDVAS